LEDEVSHLRKQLEQADERDRENRRIIAALTQRIPAIEAPAETLQEPPESPTAATEQPGRVERQAQVEGQQTPDTRPWWQRWFGSVDR
jgi:hypothetical protein